VCMKEGKGYCACVRERERECVWECVFGWVFLIRVSMCAYACLVCVRMCVNIMEGTGGIEREIKRENESAERERDKVRESAHADTRARAHARVCACVGEKKREQRCVYVRARVLGMCVLCVRECVHVCVCMCMCTACVQRVC